MENLLIAVIILIALIYVGRNLVNAFRPGRSSCGCGCSGCSNSSCSTPQQKKNHGKRN